MKNFHEVCLYCLMFLLSKWFKYSSCVVLCSEAVSVGGSLCKGPESGGPQRKIRCYFCFVLSSPHWNILVSKLSKALGLMWWITGIAKSYPSCLVPHTFYSQQIILSILQSCLLFSQKLLNTNTLLKYSKTVIQLIFIFLSKAKLWHRFSC